MRDAAVRRDVRKLFAACGFGSRQSRGGKNWQRRSLRNEPNLERAVSKGLKFDFLKAIHEHLPRHERKILKLLHEPGDQLRRLNRYEQRAASLRNKALRASCAAGAPP